MLAGAPVLRDELLRLDTSRQKDAWATGRVVVVDHHGRSPVEWAAPAGAPSRSPAGEPRLRTRPATEVDEAPPADALLLGEAGGVTYWGMRSAPGPAAAGAESSGAAGAGHGGEPRWMGLFEMGAELGALDAALVAGTVALLNWHDRAGFCARDGSPTRLANAGWARVCDAEGHEEYPRTDPAVICLVHDGADRLLLARQRTWPAGRLSVLAGFVEAGESLEACVAREISEEVGLDVRDITYLASQAWPFPRSLMIGFHAVADPGLPLRLDSTEIGEAMWVTLDDLRAALARDDWGAAGSADDGEIRLPGRMSIARTMIDSWVAAR